MMKTCYRCQNELQEPTEKHAAYVMAEDTKTTESSEVAEAIIHTQETKDALRDLQSNYYPNRRTEELEIAVASDTGLIDYLGVPTVGDDGSETRKPNAKDVAPALADFDRQEVQDVADAPPDTVRVERKVTQKSVQKTGLVCLDCKDEDDTIIWDGEHAE